MGEDPRVTNEHLFQSSAVVVGHLEMQLKVKHENIFKLTQTLNFKLTLTLTLLHYHFFFFCRAHQAQPTATA